MTKLDISLKYINLTIQNRQNINLLPDETYKKLLINNKCRNIHLKSPIGSFPSIAKPYKLLTCG